MNDVELGFLAIKKQDHQEAINIFRRALERKKEVRGYLGFGLAHYHLGDFPTARWAFSKALELDPANQEAEGFLAKSMKKTGQRKPVPVRKSLFRTGDGHLEVFDRGWKKFFIKGINLGLGIPGFFPGEFPVKEGTYLAWFRQMAELGVNSVRVYTLHPPDFYRAFHRFNSSGKRLYLFQGIWAELPDGSNFLAPQFMAGLKQEIKNTIDAVYGSARLPERPGYAHGTYDYDVSPYVAAFIVGREWESCTVKEYNEMNRKTMSDFTGSFLKVRNGNPFEVWIAGVCDFLQQYEYVRYHASHPVAAINWPTLDPLIHPSESTANDEARFQGIFVKKEICNNDEDSEVLDTAKITSKEGNGFFAVYHVYPYYPDFMSNDYLKANNTYRAYLRALKQHHGAQPVLIAEFGVPASRESAHWHRDGWSQGGHTEVKQGEIDGLLMQSIYESGMAGGILFSWFDEWFKKNWLFQPYELPSERKPFWFNFQDPEENYGFLAAYPSYPGKKVQLAARKEDWTKAQVLYEKQDAGPAFRFNDGADDARELLRLAVQHDEGFLYLMLETRGAVDFTRAHYLIGLATCQPDAGERLLPFGTALLSPVGLPFVVHLAGKDKSRILTAQSYDKYLNAETRRIRPVDSDQGSWVMMQNRTNNRRISKDGERFFPSRVSTMSRLKFGSLEPKSPHYSSLADFYFQDNSVELRIPWGLINVTDPSSKKVLWMDGDSEAKRTNGIGILAVSYKTDVDSFAARKTGRPGNHTDSLPVELTAAQIKTYSWEGWETPIFHTYLKESYYRYQRVLQSIPEMTP